MEPLFAYSFKNSIDTSSSRDDINHFFEQVYHTSDRFIHQQENREQGSYSVFEKNAEPSLMAIKSTRHHEMSARYLELFDNVKVVFLVRHPCAAINSWIKTNKEFLDKGCTIEADWKSGACRKRNNEVGEYWGFEDWLEVTKMYLDLEARYPDKLRIVKYHDLIDDVGVVVNSLFQWLNLPVGKQTADFLEECHKVHNPNPYSVYKSKAVETNWKAELLPVIAEEIDGQVRKAGLEEFLV